MITLTEAKHHLRILHDFDDTIIQVYADSAEQHIKNFLGDDYTRSVIDNEVPAPIKAACLILLADLYANRTLQADTQLYKTPTFEMLINPYITKDVN